MTETGETLDGNDLQLIADSLSIWIEREYGFERRGQLLTESARTRIWPELAGLGWLGLGIPERYGGIGGSPNDLLVTAEPFGRSLFIEPYFSTVVLGAHLIQTFGTHDQQAELLGAIARGELTLAFAFMEDDLGFRLEGVQTRAAVNHFGTRVSGAKKAVVDAPYADRLLVLARLSEGLSENGELAIALLDPAAPGVEISAYRMVDDRQAANLLMNEAHSEGLLGHAPIPVAALYRALDPCIAYLCRESLGIVQAAYDDTVRHITVRRQFGRTLSEFQVLQHRVVEMLVRLESYRSLVFACRYDPLAPGAFSRNVSAAKSFLGRSATWIVRQAIQLHGGMGVSDELIVGHYLRRLMAINAMFGNSDYHTRRFAELGASNNFSTTR